MRLEAISTVCTLMPSNTKSAPLGHFQVISPVQIRAGRALVNISQRQLAELSSVAIATIKRIEVSSGISGRATTIAAIVTTLERAGVQFVPIRTKGRTRWRGRAIAFRYAKMRVADRTQIPRNFEHGKMSNRSISIPKELDADSIKTTFRRATFCMGLPRFEEIAQTLSGRSSERNFVIW